MDEEQRKQLLKELMPDDESASRLVDYVIQKNTKRPLGTSKGSRYPYYKRVYAERLKKWLDEMQEGKCHKYLYYEEWCRDMSQQTLYHQVNQAKNYLLDYLDPDKKYRDMLELIKIGKNDEGTALCIKWIETFDGDYQARSVAIEPTIPKWKIEVMEWLEGKGDKPLVVSNLNLLEQEIVEIKQMIVGLESVKASIKSDCIKMIRIG